MPKSLSPQADAGRHAGPYTEERVWGYVLAILLSPVIVLWRQDNSLFTASGCIDPWIYLGYFRTLGNFKRVLFPHTYYGSRLPWLLPGYLLHAVFPPVLATVVLHLGVLSVGALALFTTLRMTVGARRAFLTSLIFVVNPQVWNAIGWDYVDGVAIAYCLLAMALLTIAATKPKKSWPLVLAGVAIADLVYTNLFWVVLTGLLLLYYGALRWSWGRPSPWRLLRDILFGCGSGFLLATLAFCAVNYRLDDSFWFYGPSIRVTFGLVKNNPWYLSPWTTHGLVPWLWITIITAVLAILMLPLHWCRLARGRSIALIFSAQLLLALTFLAYLQFKMREPVLGLPYYASYLLPFVFLTIGVTFWQGVETLSGQAWSALCVLTVLISGAIWGDYSQVLLPAWPHALVPAAVVGTGALVLALALSHRSVGILAGIIGFACLTAETRFTPRRQISYDSEVSHMDSPHTNRWEMERILRARERVESLRRGGAVRFWYAEKEGPSEEYIALSSTYLYEYSRFSTPFPQLSCDAPIQPDTLLVVMSDKPHAADLALRSFSACASRTGLRASLLSSSTTESPSGAYTTVLLTIERDPARWHVLKTAFDTAGKAAVHLVEYSRSGTVLPLSHWTVLYPGDGSTIRDVSDSLALKTTAKRHTDAANYGPLVIPVSGRYDFVLHLVPKSGKFAFGVVSGGAWIAADVAGHSGSDREMKCSVELQKGQAIDLRISNTNDQDVPASLVITGLSAVEFDSDVASTEAKAGIRQ